MADQLVDLARLGTSGICILAIFWIGWSLRKPTDSPSPVRHKSVRMYMLTCTVIALISGGLELFAVEKQDAGIEQDAERTSYTVTGNATKSDSSNANSITIITRFPSFVPDFNGDFSGLEVHLDQYGKLPVLGFYGTGFGPISVDLNDPTKVNIDENNGINITSPIVLPKLPK
jgi:hypothetical protein